MAVAETLDSCYESTEMVVSRLRNELKQKKHTDRM